jgi:hypothetical protein
MLGPTATEKIPVGQREYRRCCLKMAGHLNRKETPSTCVDIEAKEGVVGPTADVMCLCGSGGKCGGFVCSDCTC